MLLRTEKTILDVSAYNVLHLYMLTAYVHRHMSEMAWSLQVSFGFCLHGIVYRKQIREIVHWRHDDGQELVPFVCHIRFFMLGSML